MYSLLINHKSHLSSISAKKQPEKGKNDERDTYCGVTDCGLFGWIDDV
tara:strand:+ start:223 stop:366 length:144 start_codon:yes stop_codon:yes gene_type:complete